MGKWEYTLVDNVKSNAKNALSTGPFGSAISSKYFTDNGIPVIRGGNLSADTSVRLIDKDFVFISEEKAKEFERSKVKYGDLIFTCWGTINQVGLIDNRSKYSEYIISNKQMKLTPDPNKADSLFLYYLFSSHEYQSQILGNNIGSSVPGFNLGQLKNMLILIPGLDEQKAIAAVLSSLDDKIDLLHRQNATLEALAETLFRQWFVEEADESWEEGVLGEVIEIYDNLRIPLSKMERDKKKDGQLYPYYGAAQIMDYVNDYIFDGEYILLAEDGTVRTNEGFPVLQYATGKFWVNNHTHILKAKHPFSNFFIWNYLKKKNIDDIVTGAVQPKINQANLKSIDFPKFPKNLVIDFNNITEPLFTKINQNLTQIRTLTNLRDTLLPKLMSGEVKVDI